MSRQGRAARAARSGCAALALLSGLAALPAAAQQGLSEARATRPVLSFYGVPGLIDTPTAEMQPDGEAILTFSGYPGRWRATLGVQFTPWLFISYQYTATEGLLKGVPGDDSDDADNYDRAFNLAFRLMEETDRWPSLVLGMNDVAGTGLFASEYLVATKTFQDRLKLSGGIGWGRLGSFGSFENPLARLNPNFETRPVTTNTGGTPEYEEWFRGPAAFFGGLEWQIDDRWTAMVEYSSDAYTREVEDVGFERNSSFNFGLNYRPRPGIDIGLYSLYGSEVGLRASFSTNPAAPPFRDGREPAPPPVYNRQGGSVDLAAWGLPSEPLPAAAGPAAIEREVAAALSRQGLRLEGFALQPRTARIAYYNTTYDAQPEALGRAARSLAAVLPPEIETFVFQPVENGIPMATITLHRSDLELLEFDPDRIWKSYVRAGIADAGADGLSFASFIGPDYPKSAWSVRPYFATVFFDPDQPVRADVGLDLFASYTPLPGLIFSGNYRLKLAGNRDDDPRPSDSVLPHVRSDLGLYDEFGGSYVSHLTGEYFFRPGANLYGRATVGYMERMFAGVSTELLWKPVTGPLAFGTELNYTRQRDFEGGFGLQDYSVATGYVSAYYEFGEGYFGQVDAGRYLAGDWGATLTVSRDFANGVRFGGFVTRTDVSFTEFGEGSFDKGIFLEVPFTWLAGAPSRRGYQTVLRPVLRDGGARLYVRNRLYQTVKDYHDPDMRERWARFWR